GGGLQNQGKNNHDCYSHIISASLLERVSDQCRGRPACGAPDLVYRQLLGPHTQVCPYTDLKHALVFYLKPFIRMTFVAHKPRTQARCFPARPVVAEDAVGFKFGHYFGLDSALCHTEPSVYSMRIILTFCRLEVAFWLTSLLRNLMSPGAIFILLWNL